MVVKVADYVVTPLAFGTKENIEALKAGETRLRKYEDLPEPYVASLLDDAVLDEACQQEGIGQPLTRFERMAVLAAKRALAGTGIDAASDDTIFILSSTKGNVHLLADDAETADAALALTTSAETVARWFGNEQQPLVVCNACISGLQAQIEAMRLLQTGAAKTAVVIGADMQSPFIISGFQSFKSVSEELCRPFDEDRLGLNLGEAAACVVYQSKNSAEPNEWVACRGAIHNDAFHISHPSRTAEGSWRALQSVTEGVDASELALVNVHGTATMYNDEMEAVALNRAGLGAVPMNSLKGYFGHTMGAAGVLETVISMAAIDDETVLATKGYTEIGVSRRVNISAENRKAQGRGMVKLISGFGGSNAAMLFMKGAEGEVSLAKLKLQTVHTVSIRPDSINVDGKAVPAEMTGAAMLKEVYKREVGDYPKFYKMDILSQLGFLASELLLKAEGNARFEESDDRAVVLMGKNGSVCSDREYQQTISNAEEYFPSPSVFVYTLPNIVAGEIALRNKYHGETSYLMQNNAEGMGKQLERVFAAAPHLNSAIAGWIDAPSKTDFTAEVAIYIREKKD